MKISKKTILISSAVIVVSASIALWPDRSKEESTAIVTRKDLAEEIFVTGLVTSKQEASLAFEKGGRVQAVYADIGDIVSSGTMLAVLDRGVEIANLNDAKAVLSSKSARLQELERGTRPEQIAITESKLNKEKQTLSLHIANIPDALDTALTKAETSVYQYTEEMFFNDRTSAPRLTFNTTDQKAAAEAEAGRAKAEVALIGLSELKRQAETGPSETDLLLSAKSFLFQIQSFLIAATNAVNISNLTDAEKVAYKTSLATGRESINTALQTITDLSTSIALTKAGVETIEKQLLLEKAGTGSEEIAQARAEVERAKAAVESASASVAQKTLRSPISGTVTKAEFVAGEIVAPNDVAFVIINTKAFQIEANVPEADVAKIKKGQSAEVTLDAYGSSETFKATVVTIDPGATIVEGVPTYKTVFAFEAPDSRIKSGMTANITVGVSRRENALSVPERAILYDGDKKAYVLKKNGEIAEKVYVETGLRGALGDVEILRGLEEGHTVFVEKK